MIDKDIIIDIYPSGQKEVAKVKNPKYGICIRKIKKDAVTPKRIIRELEIQDKLDCEYYPHLFYSDTSNNQIIIYEEFIEGETLSKIFENNSKYKANEIECLKLLKQLIIGLNYIWDKDIVHRDLKPQNIIIRDNGMPVILDLGIAKILDGTNNSTTIWYTPGYAPPEQFLGNLNINKRTDFFSLGVIIYELFYGRRLFLNNDEVLNKIPNYNINGFNVSNEFIKILKMLIEKQMYKRYRKQEHILKDIEGILERNKV